MELAGKTALITGAGRGIGRAAAHALAREKADLILTDIDEEAVWRVAAEAIERYGVKCLALKMDVTKSQEVGSVVEQGLKEMGSIDILVNNAGICRTGTFEESSWEDWSRVIAVNLGGPVLCSQAVLPAMKKQQAGKIINLSSLAGEIGGISVAPSYAASKAAVACFTKSLAKYCAPFNINVNAVAPGFIDTDMTADLAQDIRLVPLGRKGTPEEVADVIFFLASERSRYITGALIDVNGGVYMK